ncbi:hypothetical protein [Streptomyces sp. NPDC056061]|uniref:hypothetical protein n=1 Tax=Streptomyces sp. NPDC056061 TaxID=3345700 RepID=UPI0035E1FC2B
MPTQVVGFRLGNDTTGRQVTILVSESGVLYRSHGLYGRPAKLAHPEVPHALAHPNVSLFQGEHPLSRPIADLRNHHTAYTQKGYTRALIPPGAVTLPVDEELPPDLSGRPELPHRELTDAFTGTAPPAGTTLEEAIREFRTSLGLPNRPVRLQGRPDHTRTTPSRAQAMIRLLAHHQTIRPSRAPFGSWSATAAGIRLHPALPGQPLSRASATELRDALTAWLHFTSHSRPDN